MASPDATINKRVAAMERIRRQLPGIRFRRFPPSVGSDYQHAADLETVAKALESRNASTLNPSTER
jgi:hypothetical protein